MTLSTHQNKAVEIRFQSSAAYPEPFRDVQLDVVFVSPSQRVIEVPAFWGGGDTWCVRYSSAEPGVHRFTTRCSDAGNAGLHGQVGSVEVTAYQGDNPLYRHGGIRVAEDQRHFCHADGTPFFWLGDTWWMGLCGRLSWPDDFQTLVRNRKERGFNLIQLVAGLYPDMPLFDERGRSASGFAWEADLGRINPAFFDEADQRVFHLVEQGLVPCILGAWGYYLPMIGLENMQRHWRHLIARWGALPVVWVAAGEQTMPWYLEGHLQKDASRARLRTEWTEVVREMRRLNAFDRLISTHPVTSARESVTDATLLDFEMQQTGHGQPTLHHARRAQEGWSAGPEMPVISAESRYEGLDIHPTVTARDAREAFWAHALNSGLAGHTYGANGIWQVNTEQRPFGPSPSGSCWGNLPWTQAMQLPGARHIGLARSFLATLPWNEFAPQPQAGRRKPFLPRSTRLQRLLLKLGWRPSSPDPIAVGVAEARSTVLAYTVENRAFTLDLSRKKGPLKGRWVDPTSFETHPADFDLRGTHLRAKPPGSNAAGDGDWLLLLQPVSEVP